MSTLDKINELTSRRCLIDSGGASGKSASKPLARVCIESIVDEGSFIEIGAFLKPKSLKKEAPADGVITGYGTVDGRLVFVYSQNGSVLGGSVGEKHAEKICNVYEMALKMGAPVIGILDSSGVRIDESNGGFTALGLVLSSQVKASGVIPQISVIIGNCMGGMAFSPALSDFVFMVGDKSKLFLSSSNIMNDDSNISSDDLGNTRVHSEITGIIDFALENKELCFLEIRKLLSFIPSNNMDDLPCLECLDDINRTDDSLNGIVPDDIAAPFDIKRVILSICDNGEFFEIKKDFANNIITGFSKFNGFTVGIIANQSECSRASLLDIASIKKISEFINFCDAFNIPILTLTDTAGFFASVSEEQNGVVGFGGRLLYAFASATVPKVNLIVRKAYGSSYLLMNSKHIGADVVYCWPTAQISPLSPEAYVNVMFSDKVKASKNPASFVNDKINEYIELNASPYVAAVNGYVDDIIVPSQTRQRVIAAFEMLSSKRVLKHSKKHSSVVF